MNELLIMRHAKSDWTTGHTDFHRPLNDRGRRSADRMATWVDENGLCPDRVISSPAVRARTTAMTVVGECCLEDTDVEFDDDLYLADEYTWMQTLVNQTAARVLICGHNPGLDDLVWHLASTAPPLSASGKLMTTAAIAHLRFAVPWSEIGRGTGELVALVRPREL